MKLLTTRSPTKMDSTTTTTTTETMPRAPSGNSYKGKSTYNNGPKVQCKFCFGPREIF